MDEGLEQRSSLIFILVLLTLGGMFEIVRLYNALKRLDDGAVNLSKQEQKSPLAADISANSFRLISVKSVFQPL